MSDRSRSELPETESEGEREYVAPHETEFTCKRCPGKIFKDSEREKHRDFHKNVRRSGRHAKDAGEGQMKVPRRPGPKSKTRARASASSARGVSPVPSATGTLFSAIRAASPAKKSRHDEAPAKTGYRKKEVSRKRARRPITAEVAPEEPDPDDMSIEARLYRAKVQHFKNSKGMNRRFKGA